MTTGQRIRAIRKERQLTQKALGDLLGISASAVGQFETNINPPKIETLEKIALALQVPISYLIGEVKQVPTDMQLDQKLSHVGYSIAYDDSSGDSYIWINYPDGTLEMSENELESLNSTINAFVLFQLEQLRVSKSKDFRPAHIIHRK